MFFSLPIACCVLARVFSEDGAGRGWTVVWLVAALLGFTFCMASNISAMHGGGLGGLFQRLSIGLYLLWLAVLALRLSRTESISREADQRTSTAALSYLEEAP